MFGLTSTDIEVILRVFHRYPDIEEAIIFGSRAMGNFKPGSDVDIALKGNLHSETAGEVSIELNERLPLPYKFDVVDYSTISHKPLQQHIDEFGKRFYSRNMV